MVIGPYRQRPAANAVDAYLEIFFRCKESLNPDGSGVMVDNVRQATYKPSNIVGATLTNGSTPINSVVPTISDPVALASGVWPNFRQRSIVLFAFGTLVDKDTCRIPLGRGTTWVGDGTDGLVSYSSAGRPHVLIRSATATLASVNFYINGLWDMPPLGTEVGVVLEYEPLNQAAPRILAKMLDTSGSIFDFGTPPVWDEFDETYKDYYPTIMDFGASGITASGDVNPGLNNMTRFAGFAYYGFIALSFPGSLPSREILDAAYLEMMTDWKKDRRYPPSQFNYLNQIP